MRRAAREGWLEADQAPDAAEAPLALLFLLGLCDFEDDGFGADAASVDAAAGAGADGTGTAVGPGVPDNVVPVIAARDGASPPGVRPLAHDCRHAMIYER